MGERRHDGRVIDVSREDKVLFPDAGITKADLVAYVERVADDLLRHLHDRPLTLQRFPDGIGAQGFYQKQVPDHAPAWVGRVEVPTGEGTQVQLTADDTATLVWLADQAAITLHPWLSRRDDLDHPDRLLVDLDPPDGDFAPVRDAARRLRDLLDELDLPAFVQTTGSRGAHVLVPLDRSLDFDEVRSIARDLAALLALRHPDTLTVEQRKAKRAGRLYLDVGRNARGQTAVAPYSPRARPGAPVATPLDWAELGEGSLDARRWTLASVPRRLAQREDPWRDAARHAVALGGRRERLAELLEAARAD